MTKKLWFVLFQSGWMLATILVVLSVTGWPLRLTVLVASCALFLLLGRFGVRRGWIEPLAGGPGLFRQPGDHRVVLQVRGANAGAVVLALRQTTGRSLTDAGEIAGQAPVIVASGISRASADAVVARLTAAGARAVAHPMEEAS